MTEKTKGLFRWILALMVILLALFGAAMAEDEEEDGDTTPTISFTITGDPEVYARPEVRLSFDDFPEEVISLSWYYSTTDLESAAIPENAWIWGENVIYPMPTDLRGAEEGWLYVRAWTGEEWVYGKMSLSFAALSSLQEDPSLAVRVLSGEDNVSIYSSVTLETHGPANAQTLLTFQEVSKVNMGSQGVNVSQAYTGNLEGSWPLALVMTRDGQQVRSPIQEISVTSAGAVPAPGYRVLSGSEIAVNGTFDVEVTPGENTSEINVVLLNETGDKLIGYYYEPVSESVGTPITIHVPILGGAAGDRVRAKIAACGPLDFKDAVVENQADLQFTLTEGEGMGLVIIRGTGDVYAGVMNQLVISCRGAETAEVEWTVTPDNDQDFFWNIQTDADAPYEFYVNIEAYKAGTYTLRATVEDEAGKTASAEYAFEVLAAAELSLTADLPSHIIATEGGNLRFDVTDGLWVEVTIGSSKLTYENDSAGEIEIQPEWLTDVDNIRVTADFRRPDAPYMRKDYRIPVLPKAPSSRVKLTAKASRVLVHENAVLNVSAPEADEIIIHRDARYQDTLWEGETSWIHTELSEGKHTYYAEAVWGDTREYSEVIEVEAYSLGKYPEDVNVTFLGLGEHGVHIGDSIGVQFTPAPGMYDCRIAFFSSRSGGREFNRWHRDIDPGEEEVTFYVPVVDVEVGDWVSAELCINFIGYDSIYATSGFYADEFQGTLDENGIYCTLPESLMTGEEAVLLIYAPGAEEVGYCEDEWSDNSEEGELLKDKFAAGLVPEEKKITVYAIFDGERKESTYTCNVTAPYGELKVDVSEVPQWLRAGEDAEIRIRLPEEIRSASLEYYFMSDEGEEESGGRLLVTGENVLTFPASSLTGEISSLDIGLYNFQIPKGYTCTDSQLTIPVLPAASERVTITAAETEVPIFGILKFDVFAPGTDHVELKANHNTYRLYPDEEGNASWKIKMDYAGNDLCYAVAYYDGEPEYSEEISVHVYSAGAYPQPATLRVEGLTEEGTLPMTEKLTLRIPAVQEVSGAAFGLFHLTDDGWEYKKSWGYWLDAGEEKTDTISSLDLQEGETYEIQSIFREITGYDRQEADPIRFTVTSVDQNKLDENGLYVDIPERAVTGESFSVTFYAPGADSVRINEDSLGPWDGDDRLKIDVAFDDPGEKTFRFLATINGATVETLRTIQVRKYVPAPTLTVSADTVDPGQSVTFTATAAEGMEFYIARLYDDGTWQRVSPGGMDTTLTWTTSFEEVGTYRYVVTLIDDEIHDEYLSETQVTITVRVPCDHSWNEGEITEEATCVKTGKRVHTCTKCGEEWEEILPINTEAHDWDEGEITTPATCSAKGEITFTCKRNAEHTKTEEIAIDADAHDWDEGEITTPATCSAEGVRTYTCKHDPEHMKTEPIDIDPDAHAWDDGAVTTPATCSAKGVRTYICQHNAEHTRTEEIDIDPDAHAWDEGAVTTPVTCSAKGVMTYTCQHNAEHTRTEEIDIDPNAHAWGEGVITTPATCHEEGVRTYTCQHNAEHTKTEVIPINTDAHEWDKGRMILAPTARAEGSLRHVCQVCGETWDEPIDKLEKTPAMMDLPTEIRKVEESAFEGSAVEGIIVHANCEWIAENAFAKTEKLVVVRFEGTETEIDDFAFDDSAVIWFEGPADTPMQEYAKEHGIYYLVRE